MEASRPRLRDVNVQAPPPGTGVQSQLTETTFTGYLDGYARIAPQELLEVRGGRVRYAIDAVGSNGAVRPGATKYRLGGNLLAVDPGLRFLKLFNPYAKRTWSVQLAKPGTRVRLYYMAPATRDEVLMFRKLLRQLETGQIRIEKVRGS